MTNDPFTPLPDTDPEAESAATQTGADAYPDNSTDELNQAVQASATAATISEQELEDLEAQLKAAETDETPDDEPALEEASPPDQPVPPAI